MDITQFMKIVSMRLEKKKTGGGEGALSERTDNHLIETDNHLVKTICAHAGWNNR